MVSYGNAHGMSFQFFQVCAPCALTSCIRLIRNRLKTRATIIRRTTTILRHGTSKEMSPLRRMWSSILGMFGNFGYRITVSSWRQPRSANDSGQNVPAETFVQVSYFLVTVKKVIDSTAYQNYLSFLAHLRTIYVRQPFFIFTPVSIRGIGLNYTLSLNLVVISGVGLNLMGLWVIIMMDDIKRSTTKGLLPWQFLAQSAQGNLPIRKADGDHNIFLVNTTGWVTWDDVRAFFIYFRMHPNSFTHTTTVFY